MMITLQQHYNLKSQNSFGIDCMAEQYLEMTSQEEVLEMVNTYNDFHILGAGYNLLLPDNLKGLSVKMTNREVDVLSATSEYVKIRVGAGMLFDDLIVKCIGLGLWGVENLSGIPSSVGASAVQNIGAFGIEAGECITEIEGICQQEKKVVKISKSEAAFGYRSSIFKQKSHRFIITHVIFGLYKKSSPNISYAGVQEELKTLGNPTLQNIRQAILNIRNKKLPDPKMIGNAGSFFKNPIVKPSIAHALHAAYPEIPVYNAFPNKKLSAAWLIEQAGCRNIEFENVGLSPKHSLIVINKTGKATGREIYAYAQEIILTVKNKFDITLEPEVVLL